MRKYSWRWVCYVFICRPGRYLSSLLLIFLFVCRSVATINHRYCQYQPQNDREIKKKKHKHEFSILSQVTWPEHDDGMLRVGEQKEEMLSI